MSTNVLAQESGNGWHLYNADNVEVCSSLPDDSVDFSIFSPPFASLYTYSNSPRDMGNVATDAEFAAHFGMLLPHLYRTMRPGRLMAMHCMLLPASLTRDGYIGLKNFRDGLVRAAVNCNNFCAKCGTRGQEGPFCQLCGGPVGVAEGFIFHSETTIWKNPVTAMQRTKALGLLHKQVKKDSARSRTGIADFLCVFMKPGENASPVAHDDTTFPVERWQRYASPVWATVDDDCSEIRNVVVGEKDGGRTLVTEQRVVQHKSVDDEGFLTFRDPRKGDRSQDDSAGIDATDTLQYMSAREDDDERHICPLQLGVIRRAIRLWTNQGDVVLDPFNGIGSSGYVALQEGRKYIGAELKPSYYNLAVRNLRAAEPNAKGSQLSMFAVA